MAGSEVCQPSNPDSVGGLEILRLGGRETRRWLSVESRAGGHLIRGTLSCLSRVPRDVADLYDAVYRQRTQDVEYYLGAADRMLPTNGRIVEIGSGTGRVALALAAAHSTCEVLCIDEDPLELRVLEESAARLGLANIEVLHTSFLEPPPAGSFDLAIAPFRVFQHALDLADLRTGFGFVSDLLRPGGRFVFDVFNPSIPLLATTGLIADEHHPLGELTIHRQVFVNQRDYFRQQQVIEERYVVSGGDLEPSSYEWTYTTRYTFAGEIEPLLDASGFRVERRLGSFDGVPFGSTPYPGELIFECTKDEGPVTRPR